MTSRNNNSGVEGGGVEVIAKQRKWVLVVMAEIDQW